MSRGGINLVKARTEALKQKGAARDYALAVVEGLERLEQERQALRALPVPAAFTSKKPDTPEAKAAREQLARIRGEYPENVGGGGNSWQDSRAA